MSLLTIIQGACDRLNLVRPSAVVSNTTDENVRKLFGLAQQEGKELAGRGTWQRLTSEKTFITIAAETQTTAVPTDFDWYIPDTMFNRTRSRPFGEPLSPDDWQLAKATVVAYLNPSFRFRGNAILIMPAPSAGDTCAYEYISKNWCQSNASVGQSSWAADTDTALLDEELHIQGLCWRWKSALKLDYAEEFATYERNVNQATDRDGARPRISTSSSRSFKAPWARQNGDYTVTP